jgi:hypothetical protein
VKKYLKPIHIGSIKSDELTTTTIEEDFRKLRGTAEQMVSFFHDLLSSMFILSIAHVINGYRLVMNTVLKNCSFVFKTFSPALVS